MASPAIECPYGFTSNAPNDRECIRCRQNLFGYRCLEKCRCPENERCDNVQGCVSLLNSQSTISANVITHDRKQIHSDTGFQNKERFIHIGSSCLLAIFVFILITYICYKRTRKKPALDNEKSQDGDQDSRLEKHLVQWIKDQKNTDENNYEDIDDSLLCDIQFSTNEEKNFDSVEDEDNSTSVKDDGNDGYLNPYQPIISTEVDVHHYDSTKDSVTSSDENQRFSGYFHPYQAPVMNSNEAKYDYTEIEHSDTAITGIQKERVQEDHDE
ncbi:Hypothetical predicted protein [Mytilus galloprovincialis]|uniref:Uncharacterized protein n=1 Tax=Mytilus galloprovincialis TaxID=29158 RepID=A0A8B6H2G3_MYTGA|nr:Hypothetical predicted protein [Mytilus galloprovincialis]